MVRLLEVLPARRVGLREAAAAAPVAVDHAQALPAPAAARPRHPVPRGTPHAVGGRDGGHRGVRRDRPDRRTRLRTVLPVGAPPGGERLVDLRAGPGRLRRERRHDVRPPRQLRRGRRVRPVHEGAPAGPADHDVPGRPRHPAPGARRGGARAGPRARVRHHQGARAPRRAALARRPRSCGAGARRPPRPGAPARRGRSRRGRDAGRDTGLHPDVRVDRAPGLGDVDVRRRGTRTAALPAGRRPGAARAARRRDERAVARRSRRDRGGGRARGGPGRHAPREPGRLGPARVRGGRADEPGRRVRGRRAGTRHRRARRALRRDGPCPRPGTVAGDDAQLVHGLRVAPRGEVRRPPAGLGGRRPPDGHLRRAGRHAVRRRGWPLADAPLGHAARRPGRRPCTAPDPPATGSPSRSPASRSRAVPCSRSRCGCDGARTRPRVDVAARLVADGGGARLEAELGGPTHLPPGRYRVLVTDSMGSGRRQVWPTSLVVRVGRGGRFARRSLDVVEPTGQRRPQWGDRA